MESQKYFIQSGSIGSGKVFIDPLTELTFGIRHINFERLASGSVTFPNAVLQDLNNIGPGQKWSFNFNGKDYELILLELNYLDDSYKVQLSEK